MEISITDRRAGNAMQNRDALFAASLNVSRNLGQVRAPEGPKEERRKEEITKTRVKLPAS